MIRPSPTATGRTPAVQRSWASLIVLALVPTLGLLVRIHSEERALLAGLGDEYRRYAATRRRLFPGIW
jgi:protein-S-isoprenylcysteine O-methyltransferase Ste14